MAPVLFSEERGEARSTGRFDELKAPSLSRGLGSLREGRDLGSVTGGCTSLSLKLKFKKDGLTSG